MLANETIGGGQLLDAVRERAKRATTSTFHVVVPQSKPRHGNVIYDEAVRDSAQVRVDLAARVHARRGASRAPARSATRTPSTPPWTRSAEHEIDEIIVSTLPSDVLRLAAP